MLIYEDICSAFLYRLRPARIITPQMQIWYQKLKFLYTLLPNYLPRLL